MNNSIKFLTIIALSLTTFSLVQAATINVDCGTTLNNAIASATAGDTLNNTCTSRTETVTIDKPITLNGNGNTIDGGWWTGTIISIESSNVTVDGFVITNIQWFGISTKNAGNVWLNNIIIQNNTINHIRNYSDSRESGIGIFVGYMSGFFQYDNNHNLLKSWLVAELDYAWLVVDNNTISNVTEGIVAQSIHGSLGSELQFTNNHISDTIDGMNGGAFYIDGSSYLFIDGNSSDNTYFGINMSSYLYDQPWVEYNTAGWSSYITITNNQFTNSKPASHRYDGAGVTIYGWQVSTMLISGNDLSNNTQHAILLAANDSISAPYNYFGDSPRTVLAKSFVNYARVPFNTLGATIDDNPYYYTLSHIRDASSSTTTGDSFVNISYTMQEILSDTTRTNGTITIGTWTNTNGLITKALTYGDNISHGSLGYSGSQTFNLNAGDYSYQITYTTSEWAGITTTWSFTIPLIAYGCTNDVSSQYTPYIRFNTDINNIDMTNPDESIPPMQQNGSGRLYNNPMWTNVSFTFNYERTGSGNPQSYTVQYGVDPSCN